MGRRREDQGRAGGEDAAAVNEIGSDDRLYGAWKLILAMRHRANLAAVNALAAQQQRDDRQRRVRRNKRTKPLTEKAENEAAEQKFNREHPR